MLKKTMSAAIILMCCVACGNNNDTAADNGANNTNATTETGTGTENTTPATENTASLGNGVSQADYDAGLSVVAQSDCLTCHKVDDKLVGPAYKEVANKYTADSSTVNMLAQKVIKGGAGNWGQVAMTPHPNLSEGDAKKAVLYVLSLK